ncbi:MAG: DUF455 family protein [Polyangiaceae bacterium]|nr:DUF455 family protein [Polyangiaceae bacterium]
MACPRTRRDRWAILGRWRAPERKTWSVDLGCGEVTPPVESTASPVDIDLLDVPPAGTVERWAWDYVYTTDLAHKLAPPPLPRVWEPHAKSRRIEAPGRPPELSVVLHASKTPSAGALRSPEKRAQLVHTFLHHELQAAELMAWASLAFASAPRAFRGGLLHILADEVRHMRLYDDYLRDLGYRFGSFAVRDWFWERVPSAQTPAQFVAVMGVGFEGANLDHTARFAERFRAIGDHRGAEIQERVGAEEIPHVRFAVRWLRRFLATETGAETPLDFDVWWRTLPPPLSPMLMRGKPQNRVARAKAGLSERFLEELGAWSCDVPGS